jgi:hypothetical protein
MKAILGLVNDLVTTLNTRGDKSPAEMGRAKRGGLRRMHTLYPRCKCLHRVIFNSVGALVGRKAGLLDCALQSARLHSRVAQTVPAADSGKLSLYSLSLFLPLLNFLTFGKFDNSLS